MSKKGDMDRELRKWYDKVCYLLSRYKQSRDIDFYLQLMYLKVFKGLDIPYITWEQIVDIGGDLGTVQRMRRKIQNEFGQYLPLYPETLKKRRMREKKFKKSIMKLEPNDTFYDPTAKKKKYTRRFPR